MEVTAEMSGGPRMLAEALLCKMRAEMSRKQKQSWRQKMEQKLRKPPRSQTPEQSHFSGGTSDGKGTNSHLVEAPPAALDHVHPSSSFLIKIQFSHGSYSIHTLTILLFQLLPKFILKTDLHSLNDLDKTLPL